ncbi:MAG TPA: ABC transporter ATP-binding protein [Thermoanaerobaculia bacterium]|jgi:subfamily B ATP-binding cassette protein MsbA|nr:ABC transporter ATP-binding protein [Thermoanaerobaculia bacterium]
MNRRFLFQHVLRPYRWPLTFAFVAMIFETATDLAEPWPLKIVLDSVIGRHPLPRFLQPLHDLLGSHKFGAIAIAAIATVAIALVSSVASYFDSYLTTSVGQFLAHDLRRKVYHHLQRLSLSYYDHHKLGNILSTITDDIDNVQSFFSASLLSIAIDIATIVGMFVVMLYLDWKFTLIAMAVTPFLFLFVQRFTRLVKQSTKAVRAKESEIVSTVEESLGAIRVIQAFAQGDLEERKLARASEASVQAALQARRVKALLSPVMDLVAAIGTALVLWYGASVVVSGQMTAGSLVVFLLYLGKMFKPMEDLAKMTNSASKAAVGMDRIQEILDSDAQLQESPGAKDAPALAGHIQFDHVAFGYEPGKPILRDVHFEIPAGKMGALVGPTGEGKSTLINLVPRLYDPANGTVKIDGEDLRGFTLKSLRDQISYVQQETVLFDESIAKNIAYGKPEATQAEIVEAAKLANADEFIRRLPQGYDTVVGERGSQLSGGQRQRIGIARAIIRNSPILILDEATSGLDAESESLVVEALDRLMKGKTSLVIAHRLGTIKQADRIMVLKGGCIAEQGTHDELITKGGEYASLYELQFGGGASAPAARA